MSSEEDQSDYTEDDSSWDSNVTIEYERAFYQLLERFLSRITAYMMTDEIWSQIPDLIATYSWLEHNPLLRSGANYENINKLKTTSGDITAPAHQRRFAISVLTPGDVLSLLPVIIENDDRADYIFQSFQGILSRAQVRAFYYFVTIPNNVKHILLKLPDMYKICHQVVEDAVSDKTAVSLLKADSVPFYLQPTIPMTARGRRARAYGKPRGPLMWTKKRADTLNDYP
jgi:hypothetical protein